MRYVGENCPYCGVTFAEGDDIVVCPECATPHHRVCWFAHGECANTERHSTDFVWRKTDEPQPETEPEKPSGNASRDSANLDIVCSDCGATCPNGTIRCPDCGAVLIPFANPTGEPPMAQFRPDFDPNENVRGIKSGDIALFCRSAGASYIKKFRKKMSFNWAALLFSPFWFFYRKLYKAGAIFITVYLALNLLTIPAQIYFYDQSAPITAEMYDTIEPYIQESENQGGIMGALYGNSTTYSPEAYDALEGFINSNTDRIIDEIAKPMIPMILISILLIVSNVVAALVADRLYYKKACTEIRCARGVTKDERAVQLELFRNGGTNIFFGAGSYFLCTLLINAATLFIMR